MAKKLTKNYVNYVSFDQKKYSLHFIKSKAKGFGFLSFKGRFWCNLGIISEKIAKKAYKNATMVLNEQDKIATEYLDFSASVEKGMVK